MSNKAYKMYKLVVLAAITVTVYVDGQNCSDTYNNIQHNNQSVVQCCQYNKSIIANGVYVRNFTEKAKSMDQDLNKLISTEAFKFNPNVSFI